MMIVTLPFLILFTLATFVASSPCLARVDLKKTKVLVMPTDPSEPLISAESAQRMLPKNAQPGASGGSVISEIVDNSFSLWWEKSDVKSTSIGRAADDIDKKLKTEVNLGMSEDKKTEHKIGVKLLAMQALAKIEYTGWVRAALNYDARASSTEAEVKEKISDHQDLILSHLVNATEKKSQVSLSWNW